MPPPPPPARQATKGRASSPNSATGRRGIPPPVPSPPPPAMPAYPRPSVPTAGIRCGPRPRRQWALRARRRGRGPPTAAKAGVSPGKAGAAAASSFRFPLAPSLRGPCCAEISVLCGRCRTLLGARPPPDSSPGSRAVRPRRLVSPGPETPGSPPPPRPCGALSPPQRAPFSAPERADSGPPASPRQVFLSPARARLAAQAAILQFPGFSSPPLPRPFPSSPSLFLGLCLPESQNNRVRAGANKEAEMAGRAGATRGDGETRLKGFPEKGSETEVCVSHIPRCSVSVLASSCLGTHCPLHLTTDPCSVCAATGLDSSAPVAVGERENEPQRAENTRRKQDLHSDRNRQDMGRVTRISAATTDRETDRIPRDRRGLVPCCPEGGATW